MNNQTSQGLAIEAKGLLKRYSEKVLAVDGVDLFISANTIYALLGPNGAGKTTMISVLTTLLKPTSGSARVAGFDVVQQATKVRQRIGVTFQEMVLDDELAGRDVLDYHGRLYGQSKTVRQARTAELLTLVELKDAANRPSRTYSGGMKRRLELARALMTTPEVLFLDEPTLGLDPQTRTHIWEYIRNLKKRSGMTVLMTTHYMEEAEALADQVGIIDLGHLIVEGTPQELITQMGADTIRITGRGKCDSFVEKVRMLPFTQTVTAGEDVIQIGVDSGSRRLVEVVSLATSNNFIIEDISVTKPSLGDVFLKYTGHQLRDTASPVSPNGTSIWIRK